MKQLTILFVLSVVMFLGGWSFAYCAEDAEEASHAKEAAIVQTVETFTIPGGELIQFNLGVLAQYSYILASKGEALIIDPVRDVDTYLNVVKDKGLKVKGVFLTHSHADFVAGHMEVASRTNSPIYISSLAGAEYSHKPLTEDSIIKIGSLKMTFLATPGHTPEGMVAQVFSGQSGTGNEKPQLLLTGDTLFVGSVGRPDLMGGTASAAWLASQMYDSWHNKLEDIGDDVRFFPAHGAGSLCGAGLSDASWSTIGEQKKTNPYLQFKGRNQFITAVISGLPNVPQYFGHNAHLNKVGPPLVDWKKLPPVVKATKELLDYSKVYVVDVRDNSSYGEAHIPGSLNIALRGRIETWTGIMVPWGSHLILTGDSDGIKEAVYRLHRVGYTVSGMLDFKDWLKSGLPVAKNERVSPESLYEKMQAGTAPVLVDVRLQTEYAAARIGEILNYPLNELTAFLSKLEKDKPVIAVCNSAYRSSLAVGVFERNGFNLAASLEGGGEAWEEEGLPMIESGGTGGVSSVKRAVNLPARLSVEELKRLLMDLPDSVEIVDVRPSEYFSDYNIPGSVNVDVSDLLHNSRWLNGKVPLIIVCRDGSISMAIGGALSQESDRQIKVLYGGVEAYWNSSRSFGRSSASSTGQGSASTSGGSKVMPSGPSSAPVASPAKSGPDKPKRRSAGC